jgi:hypothetical protein
MDIAITLISNSLHPLLLTVTKWTITINTDGYKTNQEQPHDQF